MSYSVVEMFNFSMTGLCKAVARVSALRSSFNRVNHEWQHIKDIEKVYNVFAHALYYTKGL